MLHQKVTNSDLLHKYLFLLPWRELLHRQTKRCVRFPQAMHLYNSRASGNLGLSARHERDALSVARFQQSKDHKDPLNHRCLQNQREEVSALTNHPMKLQLKLDERLAPQLLDGGPSEQNHLTTLVKR